MRLTALRIAALTGGICLVLAGWPQQPSIVRVHPEHQVVEVPPDQPHPWVEIELMHDGMDGYNLHLAVRDFTFTPENIGQEPVPNEGHAHLYINGEKISRLYSPWRHLSAKLFKPGVNRVHVVLNANDHSVWGMAGEPLADDVFVDTEAAGAPVVVGKISYRLAWDLEGVEMTDRGWKTTNDLGYEVEVNGGRLITRNLELVPCHYQPAPAPLALLPIVYAGHGSLLPNPAKISRSFEEDLADLKDVEIETREVTDPEYCQAHYLIARPTGTGPSTNALEVSGSYRKGGDWTAFEIASNLAYGELKDLDAAVDIVGGIEVSVERSAARTFDGVDFESSDQRSAGLAVLRSVVRATRISATAAAR